MRMFTGLVLGLCLFIFASCGGLTNSSEPSSGGSQSSYAAMIGLPSELTNGGSNIIQQAPAEVRLSCREKLESGYLDTANDAYAAALADYPYDPELNLGLAITIFSKLIGDNSVRQFASDLGITGLPSSYTGLINTLMSGGPSAVFNDLRYLGLPFNAITNQSQINFNLIYAKNVSDLQRLVDVALLDKVNRALIALNRIEATNDYSVSFNVVRIVTNLGFYYTGNTPVREFDLTEVYAFDTVLSVLAAGINQLNAVNMDLDWRKAVSMLSNVASNYYNPFADPNYPNFARLKPDGASRYANAKFYLKRACAKAQSCYNYLMAETDDQSDDLILKPGQPLDLSPLQTVSSSLDGNYVTLVFTNTGMYINSSSYYNGSNYVYTYTTNYYTNILGVNKFSLGRFYDTAADPRSYFFELDGNGEVVAYNYHASTGYDFTNYGIVPDGAENSPKACSNYCIRLNDPTFGNLFLADSSFFLNNSYEVCMIHYIPAISGYNTNYCKNLNAMNAVTKLRAPYAPLFNVTPLSQTSISVSYNMDSYVGFLEIYKSSDGGSTFSLLTNMTNINCIYNNGYYYSSCGGTYYDNGLSTNTTYYYYQVASNPFGTTRSVTNSAPTYN